MTWADILGLQFDEFQNWGQSGAGNGYMFNSLMEVDQRCKLGKGDTVVVCWTNIMREDRYIDGRGWISLGNIMTATKMYTKEFLADAVCERGALIRDIAFVKAAKDLLESKSGLNWKFLAMCPLLQPEPWDEKKLQLIDIIDVYQSVFDSVLPSYTDVLGHNFWEKDLHKRFRYDGGGVDYHPTTEEHLKYLDTVLPGWVTNQSLRDQIESSPLIMNKRANGSCMQRRL